MSEVQRVTPGPLIAARAISKSFGRTPALRGASVAYTWPYGSGFPRPKYMS